MNKQIAHFYRFNSFRFFAALLVMVGHAESIREASSQFNLHSISFFRNGQNAVTFFFVLSGFLITYLLLKEKNTTNKINVKHFYWKRIVRIWPLYFLLLTIGLVLQPMVIFIFKIQYQLPYNPLSALPYFLLFIPGLTTFYYGNHLLEPLWSIGVEEWFYLIWGPFIKWIKRNLFWWISGFLILKIALNQLAIYGHFPPVVVYFIRIMQMESMSLGALVALLFFKSIPLLNNHNILRLFQYTSGTLILTIVFLNKEIESILAQFGIYEKSSITLLNALVFACFIGSIALRNKMNKILDHKWLNWCGEISYGIYMYHLLIVTAVCGIISQLELNFFWSTLFLHGGSLSLTLIIAGLSKKYFEDPILKFKNSIK